MVPPNFLTSECWHSQGSTLDASSLPPACTHQRISPTNPDLSLGCPGRQQTRAEISLRVGVRGILTAVQGLWIQSKGQWRQERPAKRVREKPKSERPHHIMWSFTLITKRPRLYPLGSICEVPRNSPIAVALSLTSVTSFQLPSTPTSEVSGNYFCKAVHSCFGPIDDASNPLKVGTSAFPPCLLGELCPAGNQAFPSAGGCWPPRALGAAKCIDPVLRSGSRTAWAPKPHKIPLFHEHTRPLDIPVWSLYITWVLLLLKDLGTLTISSFSWLLEVRLTGFIVPTVRSWLTPAEPGSHPDLLPSNPCLSPMAPSLAKSGYCYTY